TVWAWGDNSQGQLGDGTNNTYRNTPVQVSGLTNVTGIAGGGRHSLALKSDGTVWAWGRNSHRQLGDVTTTDRNTPVQVIGQPPAPTGLSGTAGDGVVNLDFDNITNFRINGYNVYRSTTSGSGYQKINTSIVTASQYQDTTVTNSVNYCYVVTGLQETPCSNESNSSDEVCGTPVSGGLPPSQPTGLTATAGNQVVNLNWNDNTESAISGYNVYRSTTSGGAYSKINTVLLTSSQYTDSSLTNGTTYYYVVTAVDTAGNESGYSSQVNATPMSNPPTASASATPTSGTAPLTVSFTGTGTDDGSITKYEWDFDGNGTYDWSSTTGGNTVKVYSSAGTWAATLRVTDNDNLTGTASVTITLSSPPQAPTAALSGSPHEWNCTTNTNIYIQWNRYRWNHTEV
ncbi:MAG: PKD domain-containing protein, partial [Candidatus Omnitrophica bacterium]|nr:PKD domain-containing protein [Candidatus Omnitrophota bacterium]